MENISLSVDGVTSDFLFRKLFAICTILDAIKVSYVLSGGSFLGAYRDGYLIKGDGDIDLEVMAGDEKKIKSAAGKFSAAGLRLEIPRFTNAQKMKDGSILEGVRQEKFAVFDEFERKIGDIFLMRLFSDGMLRRIDMDTGVYVNAKMSYPVWYFENRISTRMRGVNFSIASHPELMLERIYGSNWMVPLAGRPVEAGHNSSGAINDSDVEKSVELAIQNGWYPFYPKAEKWPVEIVGRDRLSKNWIDAHEHPGSWADQITLLHKLPQNKLAVIMAQLYKLQLSRYHKKLSLLEDELIAVKKVNTKEIASIKKENTKEIASIKKENALTMASMRKIISVQKHSLRWQKRITWLPRKVLQLLSTRAK